ncbi:MAG: hypothetical protein H6707_20110 [Deltaproteobacteria bacterium]|nr:hypothetical protein [Deltaproteobacteria bacterium]
MSEDSYREVSEESWLSRLVASIKRVAGGVLLLLAAIPLLYWNEGRAVQAAAGLAEGAAAVINADANTPLPANEGKLIHLSGEAKAQAPLTDPTLGVRAPNALRLMRTVEMYQWREEKKTKTKKKIGGKTVTVKEYRYEQVWSEKAIDDSNFKQRRGHFNPGELPQKSLTLNASDATLGKFTLPTAVLERLVSTAPLAATNEMRRSVAAAFGRPASIDDGKIFLGFNPNRPRVGDVRVSYAVVAAQPISLVAQQRGKTLAAYTTKSDQSILLVQQGRIDAKAMFSAAVSSANSLTWILRGVGFAMLFFGLLLFFGPIAVVADVVPLFGDLLRFGITLFSGTVAAALALVTVSISWLIHRPLIGSAMLLAGIALFAGLLLLGKKRKARQRQDDAPAPQHWAPPEDAAVSAQPWGPSGFAAPARAPGLASTATPMLADAAPPLFAPPSAPSTAPFAVSTRPEQPVDSNDQSFGEAVMPTRWARAYLIWLGIVALFGASAYTAALFYRGGFDSNATSASPSYAAAATIKRRTLSSAPRTAANRVTRIATRTTSATTNNPASPMTAMAATVTGATPSTAAKATPAKTSDDDHDSAEKLDKGNKASTATATADDKASAAKPSADEITSADATEVAPSTPAADSVEPAAKISPKPSIKLARRAIEQTDYAEARAHFAALLRNKPDEITFAVGLALAKLELGDASDYQRLAQAQPNQPMVQALVMRHAMLRGDWQTAHSEAQRLRSTARRDPLVRLWRAEIDLQRRQYARAKRAYLALIKDPRYTARARIALSKLELATNYRTKALSQARKALAASRSATMRARSKEQIQLCIAARQQSR